MDRLGDIDLQVTLESPVSVAVTDATIYLDGSAVGNPDANGQLTLSDIPVGTYVLTAGLEKPHANAGGYSAVGARRSTPAQAILPLKYNTGTITAEIAMEGTDICPSVDNLNGDVLQLSRANVIVSNIQMNSDTCVVSAEVPIGLVQTTSPTLI